MNKSYDERIKKTVAELLPLLKNEDKNKFLAYLMGLKLGLTVRTVRSEKGFELFKS